MSSPSESDPSSNMPLLGEHYQLTDKLGEGAFGEVYKATHDLLGQDFAVKLLKPELSPDQDVQDRFLDEARALIRFSHPNVVQMRHVGRHQGRLFLVMDYVQGVELAELMRKDGAFDEKRALALMTQILSGLEAAHAGGIVHRDLKPSNILVEKLPDGSEKAMILDFGLSKFSAIDGPGGAHRSITGTIVGTLAYMSPEQIKGDRDIDGRSDLFAAGLILQEMLQGHHPYPGESGIVVAAKLLRDPIPPIDDEKRDKISDDTLSALARALERDRDARFSSVTAFSQSLAGKGPPSDTSKVTTIQEAQAELARQEALEAARQAKSKASAPSQPDTVQTRASAATPGSAGGKKSPLLPILVIAGLAVAAGAFFLFGQDDPKDDGGGTRTTKAGDPDTNPTPHKGDPVKATPSKSTPSKAEPGKTTPNKAEPKQAEPKQAEPKQAEPKQAEPKQAEPKQAEPKKAEPAKAGPNPERCCESAAELMAQGKWVAARDLFKKAAGDSKLSAEVQVTALRGAAEAWIAEADHLARSGKIDAALAAYAAAGAWFDGRHSAYEKVERAVEVARLQLGFSRLHQAEAQTERARWLRIQGKRGPAAAELKKAATNFDFAVQQLDRDGVRFWEFLVRRAEMHRMAGNSEAMIADVAHTTKTNNTEVPPHMWIAHAQAARHIAEAYTASGDTAQALAWAKKASKVSEDGAGWQEENLTRAQWLEFARVLFLQASLLKGEDPTPLHGKARYWISQAKGVKAPVWEHGDVVKARMQTAAAMERYMDGLVQRHRGKGAAAATAFAAAETLASQAIALRESAAKQGAAQVDSLPYEVMAAIQTALGKGSAAQGFAAKATAADARNPD